MIVELNDPHNGFTGCFKAWAFMFLWNLSFIFCNEEMIDILGILVPEETCNQSHGTSGNK